MGKISSAAAAVPGGAAVTQRAGMYLPRSYLARSQFGNVLCTFRLQSQYMVILAVVETAIVIHVNLVSAHHARNIVLIEVVGLHPDIGT